MALSIEDMADAGTVEGGLRQAAPPVGNQEMETSGPFEDTGRAAETPCRFRRGQPEQMAFDLVPVALTNPSRGVLRASVSLPIRSSRWPAHDGTGLSASDMVAAAIDASDAIDVDHLFLGRSLQAR
jgi:hypothetical protein